jgi:hypothetical protein
MLIYLIKRDLPWESDFKKLNREKYFNLLLSKDTDGFGKLFNNIPSEIIEFVKYSKNLKFDQDPDYSYLRSLFNKLFLSKNIDYRKLTFSFIHSKDKKLLGMPRNNSTRKESPQFRILKNIKEERSKRLITSNVSLSNLKNDSQIYSPLSTKANKVILYNSNNRMFKFTHSEKDLRSDNNSNNFINVFNTINNKKKEIDRPFHKYNLKKRNKITINTSDNYTLNSMFNCNDSYSFNKQKSYFISNNKEKKSIDNNKEEKSLNTLQIKKMLKNSHSLNITPSISYKSSFRKINKNNYMNMNRNNNQMLSKIDSKPIFLNNNMIYKSPLLKNYYSVKNDNEIKIQFNEPINNYKKIPKRKINLTSYKIPRPIEMASLNINRNQNLQPFTRDIKDINFVFINNNIKFSPKQNKKIQLCHCNTLKELKNKFINKSFQTYNNH